jgi:hypothetical protein
MRFVVVAIYHCATSSRMSKEAKAPIKGEIWL